MTNPLGPIEIPEIPTFDDPQEELDWLRARHDELEAENAELRFKNLIWQNELYGKRSEKSKAADDESGQTRLFDEVVADDVTGPDATKPDHEKPKRQRERGQASKRSHGRKPINRELQRIEREHGNTGPRFDADGNELVITGWDERERLHVIPEQVVVLVDKYAIWGLPDTRETVETTPVLPSIIPGGKLSDDFLIEIARRKYLLSLPLHRQLRDFNALGAELAVSTMSNGIRAVADFLDPICDQIRRQILSKSVIHIDETTMRQQSDAHGSVTRYLWAWHSGGQVSFHYGGRAADEIRTVLQSVQPPDCPDPPQERYAVTDGYAAYDTPLAAAGFTHAGCWAHIRRHFKQLAPASTHAQEVFHEIAQLYRCEKSARKAIGQQKLHGAAADALRLQYRQEQAQPTLDRIADLVERYRPLYKPKGLIGAAFTTLANQFTKLRVYAATGCVPIDNNDVERDMRQVALGRKNYLFVGSEDAGAWCATMYTLIESARLSNIDVRAYLARVVAGMHDGEDPGTMTPAALRKTLPKAKAGI